MIYSVYLIDADSGILLLERSFKSLEKQKSPGAILITQFFKEINTLINDIQSAMRKGRDVRNMNRILSSEQSSLFLHFQPEGHILVCAVSDPEDETEEIVAALKKIGNRFWQKFRHSIEAFRKGGEKKDFNAFIVDIDNTTLNGKVALHFPQLHVNKKSLLRLIEMGAISQIEFDVAMLCTGENTKYHIMKQTDLSMFRVTQILHKLERLDILAIN